MNLTELCEGGDLLARVEARDRGAQWAARHDGLWYSLGATLTDLCTVGVAETKATFDRAITGHPLITDEWRLLAPVDDNQEVWAAGVTYERSRTARIAESGAHDLYSDVYDGERPELFFKSVGRRVVGPGARIGVRADAAWSVPEPELTVVFAGNGDVLGFTVGNDVSSRDIEGTNALYLPQAKVYDRSCALGPAIAPIWNQAEGSAFGIRLRITRGGDAVFTGEASTAQLRRSWPELGKWLRACMTFDAGVLLMTGTGIVPSDDVALIPGDAVSVEIGGVGALDNEVVTVGQAVFA
jgi:2-dehydro-3-deoxy-D-arabinonate dehydratase